MKKALIIVTGVFMALAFLSFSIKSIHNPENAIVGEWKEVNWVYDRVYNKSHITKAGHSGTEEIKNISSANLGIDHAEKWIFNANGELLLSGKGIQKVANWKIKGRGNILVIRYKDGNVERYDISELTKEVLTLRFTTEASIPGIAKVSCVKI